MTVKITLVISIFCPLITISIGHQSIADPTPIAFIRDCRIGNGKRCPGPCPRKPLRKDVTPQKPQVTVRRGGILPVKTFKNNHLGGFVRWSLVKVKDMYSHSKHRSGAFLYSCADQRVSKCTKKNRRRFCPDDEKNEYYQHYLRIPQIYDDGVYVLGFAWYGGLTKKRKIGFFGDYYDCVYVRVRGGPKKNFHTVTFAPGKSVTAKGGKCKATVDRLGPCRVEPCRGKGPGGYKLGRYMKPAEFSGNKRPKKLKRVRN